MLVHNLLNILSSHLYCKWVAFDRNVDHSIHIIVLKYFSCLLLGDVNTRAGLLGDRLNSGALLADNLAANGGRDRYGDVLL